MYQHTTILLFFTDTATTEIYTLSLHDALPILGHIGLTPQSVNAMGGFKLQGKNAEGARRLIDEAVALERAGCFSLVRSEEHTSELQSRLHLVCRLLLEKKKIHKELRKRMP